MTTPQVINLQEIIGKGYKQFWNNRKRFLVCKGSKGSKKSTTAALKIVYNIMKYPLANALVVRRYGNTLRTSCFAQVGWAINTLGAAKEWKENKVNLEYTYLPTGQKIMFRGMDDPQKLASIVVAKGHLCWVWIEEAFQVMNEDDFDKINLSLRGRLPAHLWKEIILTFNPWSSQHWMKKRFFDHPDDDTLAMTTTYRVNEWLDSDDVREIEKLKEISPRKFAIVGDGEWGIAEGLIFDNFKVEDFDRFSLLNATDGRNRLWRAHYGLDFGFTTSPTGAVQVIAPMPGRKEKRLYIAEELYKFGMTNENIVQDLTTMGWTNQRIICDSAEPKSIQDLKEKGLVNVKASKKGADSIRAGIQKLQEYEIIIHPDCPEMLIELSNYTWEMNPKTGKPTQKPIDDMNHLIDPLRYSIEGLGKESISF
jgi:phage terminase large subunit